MNQSAEPARRGFFIAFGLLVAVSLAGCNSPGAGAGRSTPGTTKGAPRIASGPAGPIAYLITAASVDKNGVAVDPAVDFEPSASKVVALARIGNLKSSHEPMTFTWFQDGAHGKRQQLFVSPVTVSSADRAFSTGNSPGFLLQGAYSVVAAVEGATMTANFYVAADPPTAGPSPAPTGPPPPVGLGGPPVSGEGGDLPFGPLPSPTNSTTGPAGCQLGWVTDPNNTFNPTLITSGCGSDSWAVSVGGVAVARGMGDNDEVVGVDPCKAGASDLPGAKFDYTARVVSGPDHDTTLSTTATIPPDTVAPSIGYESDPIEGGQVLGGETISLTIDVTDIGIGSSGVKSVMVTAGDTVVAQQSYGTAPTACDLDRFEQTMYASYKVPANPPDVVILKITAEDFAGNPRNIELQWYTKVQWVGIFPFDGVLVGGGQDCHTRWILSVQIDVPGAGAVHGIAQADRGAAICEVVPDPNDALPEAGAFDVLGTFDPKSGFKIHLALQTTPNGHYTDNFDFFVGLQLLVYPDEKTITLPLKNRSATESVDLKYTDNGQTENGIPYTDTLDGYAALILYTPG